MDGFEFIAASVAGRSHRLAGRNNQDAFACTRSAHCMVAVVCDGCGSGARSEVGAQIGAALTVRLLSRHAERWLEAPSGAAPDGVQPFPFWEAARRDVLARLRTLAQEMGDDIPAVVSEYLLFTVVGALLTPRGCSFFSIGDGVLAVNDEIVRIGPFPGNAPPYLSYGLLDDGREPPRFQVHRLLPAQALQSFLLGTDGVGDLLERLDRPLPRKQAGFGPLSHLWREDRYFRNPDALRRKLEDACREVVALDRETGALCREPGLLPDDTTVMVGRRITEGGCYESDA